MAALPNELQDLIRTGPIAHLATINADGAPQVSAIWIGLDDDDIVSGHMNRSLKVRNAERDPRVVLSFDAPRAPGVFLADHAVLRATASVEEGGAWSLLDRLGKVYVGADFTFPGEAPGGFVLRYTVTRVGGVGPWVAESS